MWSGISLVEETEESSEGVSESMNQDLVKGVEFAYTIPSQEAKAETQDVSVNTLSCEVNTLELQLSKLQLSKHFNYPNTSINQTPKI